MLHHTSVGPVLRKACESGVPAHRPDLVLGTVLVVEVEDTLELCSQRKDCIVSRCLKAGAWQANDTTESDAHLSYNGFLSCRCMSKHTFQHGQRQDLLSNCHYRNSRACKDPKGSSSGVPATTHACTACSGRMKLTRITETWG